jgi:intracellular multiplication protein IcmJ
MLEISFGLLGPSSPYADRGCFDHNTISPLGPAAKAAQMRDAYVCQYCGFQSRKYQRCTGPPTEIAQDLTTACIFCEQVLHLDLVPRMRSGVLIWLPEMEQVALNRSMPELYVRRFAGGPPADLARNGLDRLMVRRDKARSEFGSDDPAKLVERLKEPGTQRSEIDQLMHDGLRLLPLDRRIVLDGNMEFNLFPQIMAYWRSQDGPLSTPRSRTFESFGRALVAI